LLIVRPEEGIYFANAAPLREKTRDLALAADPPPKAVVVDLEMTDDLDAPSAHELAELHGDRKAADMQLMLARVRAAAHEVLDRSGATEVIGAENLQPRVLAAVAAHLSQAGGAVADVIEMSEDSLQRLIEVIDAQLPAASGADQERLATLRERLQEAVATINQNNT
jgi:MFS superfamily sulfate permease-like transporter